MTDQPTQPEFVGTEAAQARIARLRARPGAAERVDSIRAEMCTPSDARQRVNELVFWSALEGVFAAVVEAARDDAEAAMVAGDHEKITATDAAGEALGSFSRTMDGHTWDIVDPDAYRAWVLERRPDQTVTTVSAMFTKWVVQQAARNNGIVADPETGEMIPGLGRRPKPGRFTLRSGQEAKARAREALRAMMTQTQIALPPSVAALFSEEL